MPFNGAGTFTLVAGNPVVTGTVISSTIQNNTMSDVATGLTTCVTRNGQSPPTANLPMGGFKLTGLASGTAATDAVNVSQLQGGAYSWGTATGTGNAIVLAITPSISAYVAGQTFSFQATASNSGATTIAVSALTATAIRLDNVALVGGEIVSGHTYSVTYDGTYFQLKTIISALKSTSNVAIGAALIGLKRSILGAQAGTLFGFASAQYVNFAYDFGGVGDWNGATGTDNTAAFVRFAAFVNSVTTRVCLTIPPGNYAFSPQNTYNTPNAWRIAVEMVDVDQVVVFGYGATLTQNIPSNWVVGDPANNGNEEGPLQFRSSVNGGCTGIAVLGVTVVCVKLTFVATDGAAFGIALRAVVGYVLRDCTVLNASTDGLYLGASYSSTYAGSNGLVDNCVSYNSNRNGLSVVWNSQVKIRGGEYTNSTGGSLQAGIDLEPDSPNIQSDIVIDGAYIAGNGLRGICNIRSKQVKLINNTFGANGKDISIEGVCSFVEIYGNEFTSSATQFSVTGATNTDINFHDNQMYLPGVPNYFITIGSGGVSGYSNFYINNNHMVGESGMLVGAVGGLCQITNNTHVAKIINGSIADTNVFIWNIAATNAIVKGNIVTIDASITWTGTKNNFQLVNGYAEGNIFTSHSGAVCSIISRSASFPAKYGFNNFSTYFFYDENLTSAFRILGPGAGVQYVQDGSPGTNGGARIVTGAFSRTTNINAQDNQVGDITYNYTTTSGNPIAYRCTVAGVAGVSAGTWVGLWNKS